MTSSAPRDLTDAFGTPARAQLGGLLPKRSSQQAAPTPAPAPPEPVDTDPTPADPAPPSGGHTTAPATASRPAPAEPAAADATTTQVSVYLTPDAVAAARRARAGRRTNADVALEAIDATVDQLPALLAARRSGPDRPGSLFPARQRGRRAPGDVRRALWSMKATAAELAVVDRLVTTLGAGSRSELIATAMEAHLLRPRRRRT